MRYTLSLSVALVLSGLVNAKSCEHKLKESIPHPKAWKKTGVPPADHTITLGIALPQHRFDELHNHLVDVSDPDHERYGQYLTHEQVNDLVAPHPDSLNALTEWLSSHGIPEADITRSPANDWAHITVPLPKAELMLNTTYHIWEHESGDTLVRTTHYSLPEDIFDHVELIQPTTMFARWNPMRTTLFRGDEAEPVVSAANLKSMASADDVDPSCNSTITPLCLRQIYNAVGYTPQVPEKGSIGITSYLEQYINDADLQQFYAKHVPEALDSNYTLISVNGGENLQDPLEAGFEAALDAQYAFGLTYPIPRTAWTTGGSPPWIPTLHTPENTNEPYDKWLSTVLAMKDVPKVISTSYGEEEQSVPESYGRRACRGFAQLGAKGVSVFFSSGDFGVGDGRSVEDHLCLFEVDGKNVTQFMPTFPASCPYVTAVGGTYSVPERAVFFSGGGFSTWFDTPWYQKKTINQYLKTLPEGLYEGLYNPKGRAFPDVAALGRRFEIIIRSTSILIGGTSASSPAFAALTALLNDARAAKGLPSLGFINPLMYSKGYKGLNDITEGNNNPGCGTEGFFPAEGWDPVTGLGTPNFGELLKIVT